jgi:DNA-binding NarL/FixJ family response regulator
MVSEPGELRDGATTAAGAMPMNTTILIADDHAIVRQGIRALLEQDGFTVVGEARNGREAIRLATREAPMLALLDFSMPLLNGIDTAQEIQKRSPETMVLLLTMYNDEKYVIEALRAGIRGYVLKDQVASDLANAIREVVQGSIYLSPGISRAVVQNLLWQNDLPDDQLTGRERQVLQLIAEGNTTKDIAEMLHVSAKTVESHRAHIMRKLDLHNIAGLVRYAIREGMIQA